jgi:hypothetical protein
MGPVQTLSANIGAGSGTCLRLLAATLVAVPVSGLAAPVRTAVAAPVDSAEVQQYVAPLGDVGALDPVEAQLIGGPSSWVPLCLKAAPLPSTAPSVGGTCYRLAELRGAPTALDITIVDDHTAQVAAGWEFMDTAHAKLRAYGGFCSAAKRVAVPANADELVVLVGVSGPFGGACAGPAPGTSGWITVSASAARSSAAARSAGASPRGRRRL